MCALCAESQERFDREMKLQQFETDLRDSKKDKSEVNLGTLKGGFKSAPACKRNAMSQFHRAPASVQ